MKKAARNPDSECKNISNLEILETNERLEKVIRHVESTKSDPILHCFATHLEKHTLKSNFGVDWLHL